MRPPSVSLRLRCRFCGLLLPFLGGTSSASPSASGGPASCVLLLVKSLSALRFAQCVCSAVSGSSASTATVLRRSSSLCRPERDRRSAARTDRGAPSPFRIESAITALRELESGGINGPGISRDILPRADRVRKLCGVGGSSGRGRAALLGDGGRGDRGGLVGVSGSAGEEDDLSRAGGFDVAGVKYGVEVSWSWLGGV
jgi:hypothetical protein